MLINKMAEGVGFEPTVPVKAQQFSRLSRSTTLAPLRRREIRAEISIKRAGRSKGGGL